MDARTSPDCRRCRAFFVTHEARFPYGCHAFGMRTRSLPSAAVLESSGAPCRAFEPRAPGSDERPTSHATPLPRRTDDGWEA